MGNLKQLITTIKTLMHKVESMQEQMGNISKEMETRRKKKKKMPEIKNTITGMNNAPDGLLVDQTSCGKNL